MTDWDAATYDRVAEPQEQWGLRVLDRLDLEGGETVLDAGCGSGRMTRHIVERLPRGRVIGVDASPSMIETARERLGDSVELHVQDLLELELGADGRGRVDAVFSSATFHWVPDHERLFARLFAILRPGGRLEAQCGGLGNIAEVENAILSLEGDERFSAYLRSFPSPWNFAGVAETQARLERAGFGGIRVWLEDAPVQPAEPREFVAASVVGLHLDRLPETLRNTFLDVLMESLPGPLELRYVRLNISARRPA